MLRDQLTFIQDEDVQMMHDALYTKYTMFKYVLHNKNHNSMLCCWLEKTHHHSGLAYSKNNIIILNYFSCNV